MSRVARPRGQAAAAEPAGRARCGLKKRQGIAAAAEDVARPAAAAAAALRALQLGLPCLLILLAWVPPLDAAP